MGDNRLLPPVRCSIKDNRVRYAGWVFLGLAIACLIVPAEPILGQDRESNSQDQQSAFERGRALYREWQATPFLRNEDTILTVFGDVVADASASTIKVMDGSKMLGLGTAVSADGYVVTKASELTPNFKCELHDGTRVPAEVVGIHVSEDVALLKISGHELVPADWDSDTEPEVGSWIASVGQTTTPIAVGVVSVKARPISPPEGVMGVYLDDAEPGALVTDVIPGSPAQDAGLARNDVVLRVNGESVSDRPSLQSIVKKKRPGDVIELYIRRNEEELSLLLELGNRQELDPLNQRSLQQNELGGTLSGVREGFSQAIQHDSGIEANECGGPVVGLSGRPIGINIARAGRVNSYVLPASVIVPLVEELKSGKYAPAEVNKLRIAKLDEEIAALRKEIEEDIEPSIKEYEAEMEKLAAEEQTVREKVAEAEQPTEEDQKRLEELVEQQQDVKKQLLPARFRLERITEDITELEKERSFLATGLKG